MFSCANPYHSSILCFFALCAHRTRGKWDKGRGSVVVREKYPGVYGKCGVLTFEYFDGKSCKVCLSMGLWLLNLWAKLF